MAFVGAILAAFYLVAVAVAMVVFGQGILPIAIVGSLLLIGIQYKIGKWAALRSVGAEDLSETQYSQIHQFVEQVCRDKNMKKPSLKIASMGVPNAFAVGRRGNGTVVISRELIQLLDRDELEGVIAHEIAHIDNRDVITMQLGQGIASIVAIVAQFAVLFTGDNDLADFFLAIVVGNKSVMVALTNPQLATEGIAESDNYRLATETDMRAREQECLRSSYFRQESKANASKLRNRLAEAIIEGNLPNPHASTSTSTVADELKTSGEEYAYLTNFYKFATTGFDGDSSPNLSGHVDWFDAELSALNSDYLVGLGAPLWDNYLRSRVEPHAASANLDKSTIEASSVSDEIIIGNRFTLPAHDVTVIPGRHPQAMETGELV
nr:MULTISPECIES: M48 family metalloprotease [Haloarculaceae]